MSETNDERVGSESTATLLNAIIGAVVGVVLSFIPFSPILGGAVAGYLEGGSGRRGLKVGALAGFLMLIPLLFFAMFLLIMIFGFAREGAAIAFAGIFIMFFMMIYTLGLSILGGYLGVYLKKEL